MVCGHGAAQSVSSPRNLETRLRPTAASPFLLLWDPYTSLNTTHVHLTVTR
jgi:hypothetical protein